MKIGSTSKSEPHRQQCLPARSTHMLYSLDAHVGGFNNGVLAGDDHITNPTADEAVSNGHVLGFFRLLIVGQFDVEEWVT